VSWFQTIRPVKSASPQRKAQSVTPRGLQLRSRRKCPAKMIHGVFRMGWGLLVIVLLPASSGGCSGTSANWLKNGLLDPTQAGNFEKSTSNEIREALSILDEPTGIQNADEPTAQDVTAEFAEERIGPGDVMNVSMFEVLTPGVATNIQVRVGNSGFETFPVVGQARVLGLTPREMELELKERLRAAGVLEDADVQVTVVQSQATQYAIIGNIARPSVYPLPRPNYTLLEGIAAAGGIPPQVETIYVFRPEPLLPAASPTSRTASSSKAVAAKESAPVSLTMSDTSSARVASRREPPPESEAPTTAQSVVDELEILEGQPAREAAAPRWDPDKGEWVVEEPAPAPVTSKARQGEVPPTPSGPATTARAASAPAIEGEEPEEEPWVETREMAPPIRIIEIAVKELLDGDPRYNIFLRPGDTVNVPLGSVGEYYLGGNVTRPGAYALTGRRITVKQAIVSGGGFGPLAWPSRAEVVRRVGKDEEQIIQLNLDAIFAGTAPDFYVKPNDIVNVGTNAAAVFLAVLRNAFRFSYGFGFVYDRNFADSDTFDAKQQLKAEHRAERVAKGLPAY
jgi:polysaccharide biosynthesis/export protein